MKKKQDIITNEKGLTLIEILAGIVILTLIFVSVIALLNSSMRMNKTSEKIIDATYVVQEEMEQLYKYSTENVHLNHLTEEYSYQGEDGGWEIYHKQAEGNFFLEIKQNDSDDPLVRVVVSAYDQNDSTKKDRKAQMETLLLWGDENETSP